MQQNMLKARRAYKITGDDFVKNLLADIFGKEALTQDIRQVVTSFETACQYTGENPNDPKFKQGDASDIAFKRCKVCAKAWKEGKVMRYGSGERLWFPVLRYEAGVGFRFWGANNDNANAPAPAAIRVDTKESSSGIKY